MEVMSKIGAINIEGPVLAFLARMDASTGGGASFALGVGLIVAGSWLAATAIYKLDQALTSVRGGRAMRRVARDLNLLMPLCRLPDDVEAIARASKDGIHIMTMGPDPGGKPEPETVRVTDPDAFGSADVGEGEPFHVLVRSIGRLHRRTIGYYMVRYRGRPPSATIAAAERAAKADAVERRLSQMAKHLPKTEMDAILKAIGRST